MKQDVLSRSEGKRTEKILSKESLNHQPLIEWVSGVNVYRNTHQAYLRAYEALGLDLILRVPSEDENAPAPTPPGQITHHPDKPYSFAALGVYDTALRHTYACKTPEDVWELDVDSLEYEDLIVPVPHSCTAEDVRLRQAALGDIGLYYPMLYTTLFMWAVEVLGWEVFMLSAMSEPERFHDHFLLPCVQKSKAIVDEMAMASDSPFIFVHDDLANQIGPVFNPSWYDEFIFPHYPEIWGKAKSLGKKIIFVADGNMTAFIPKLRDVGVDGMLYENPATPLEVILEHFGATGGLFIGGIETAKLTFGTPDEVRKMVFDIADKCADFTGFVISSPGGLHNGIPMKNLEAYFDARVQIGATPEDWRTRFRQ